MPSQQPPDPLTDGTFPDFPPRGDLQNTLYLFDPAGISATRIATSCCPQSPSHGTPSSFRACTFPT